MTILCQKKIPLPQDPKNDHVNTYCMRPQGHKGECNYQPLPEDKKPVS